jgi:hypothetical protein
LKRPPHYFKLTRQQSFFFSKIFDISLRFLQSFLQIGTILMEMLNLPFIFLIFDVIIVNFLQMIWFPLSKMSNFLFLRLLQMAVPPTESRVLPVRFKEFLFQISQRSLQNRVICLHFCISLFEWHDILGSWLCFMTDE